MTKTKWSDRASVSRREDAIATLGDLLSDKDTITELMREDSNAERLAALGRAVQSGTVDAIVVAARHAFSITVIDEAEQFANTWGIPFDRELVTSLVAGIDRKHGDYHEGYWYTSTNTC